MKTTPTPQKKIDFTFSKSRSRYNIWKKGSAVISRFAVLSQYEWWFVGTGRGQWCCWVTVSALIRHPTEDAVGSIQTLALFAKTTWNINKLHGVTRSLMRRVTSFGQRESSNSQFPPRCQTETILRCMGHMVAWVSLTCSRYLDVLLQSVAYIRAETSGVSF